MRIEVSIVDLAELARRSFEAGATCNQYLCDRDIENARETLVISLLTTIQEEGKFIIPPTIGKQFLE